MAGTKELRNSSFIVILIIVIYVFAIQYYKESGNIKDINKDGKLDEIEIYDYLKNSKEPVPPANLHELYKAAILGGFRGLLMGLVIGGVDVAIGTSITLGMVSVLVKSIEHMI